MLKNLRKSWATIAASLALLLLPMAIPVAAHAATDSAIQNCLAQGTNLDTSGNGTACNNNNTDSGATNIQSIVKTIVNIFSLIVGIVAVIMIIFGGFKYITSGGDSGNVGTAKNTIVYAVIGLVVVALAQFIVQFVLNKVTT